MTWDAVEAALAAVGLKLVNVLAGASASFVALRFFDQMRTVDKWTTFFGGWAIAAWGAAPLREYLELKPGIEVGLVLVLGLFGMALAAEIIKLIRSTDWIGLFRSAVDYLLRRKSNGGGKED